MAVNANSFFWMGLHGSKGLSVFWGPKQRQKRLPLQEHSIQARSKLGVFSSIFITTPITFSEGY